VKEATRSVNESALAPGHKVTAWPLYGFQQIQRDQRRRPPRAKLHIPPMKVQSHRIFWTATWPICGQ